MRKAVVALLLLVSARPLAAQTGEGFLFSSPNILISLSGGFAQASAGSELFSFVSEQLTLDSGDFSGFSGGLGLGLPLSDQFAVELRTSVIGRERTSEYRDYVGTDDLPIEQTTEFYRVPVLAIARLSPLGRGRTIGSFAWVPRAISPFVGAGAGGMWYRFEQVGEFVDFETNDIFADTFTSSGWTPAATVVGGLDINLTSRFYLTAEGSYLWAESDLDRDFVDFDPIDLSGATGSFGISIRL